MYFLNIFTRIFTFLTLKVECFVSPVQNGGMSSMEESLPKRNNHFSGKKKILKQSFKESGNCPQDIQKMEKHSFKKIYSVS